LFEDDGFKRDFAEFSKIEIREKPNLVTRLKFERAELWYKIIFQVSNFL